MCAWVNMSKVIKLVGGQQILAFPNIGFRSKRIKFPWAPGRPYKIVGCLSGSVEIPHLTKTD